MLFELVHDLGSVAIGVPCCLQVLIVSSLLGCPSCSFSFLVLDTPAADVARSIRQSNEHTNTDPSPDRRKKERKQASH